VAIVVEDGTGKADAESYISVSDASSYHSARGNAAWAALASDTVREQCLRKATEYMGQVYGEAWAGYRVSSTQALDWPRYEVPRRDIGAVGYLLAFWASDAVPEAVQRACAELALRAASGDLLADLGQPAIEKTVGPITVRYAEGARQTKRYPAVDGMLTPFLKAGGTSAIQVVRA